MSSDAFWIVGCGAMAGAMLARWVEAGDDAARFTVIDPGTPQSPEGVRCLSDFPDEAPPAWLMLGVKPQMLSHVAARAQRAVDAETVVLSILAGTTHSTLTALFADAGSIVRVMPNLPVRIGKGVVALYGTQESARVTRLMALLGLVEWIDDEGRFDAVTALSGSGPAFVYRFIDALAKGGAALGLPRDQADRMALATVAGAGALAAFADVAPGDLADRVASRGGSTREGLDVLDGDAALDRLIAATLAAAQARNRMLGLTPG